MSGILISFETAKLAKEKKFNWGDSSYYTKDGKHESLSIGNDVYKKPTQLLLKMWLKKKHNVDIFISKYFDDEHCKDFYQVYNSRNPQKFKHFRSYTDALEKGLFEALKCL